jgi:hypothetical protein
MDERVTRTPTDAELIAAGWKSPPPPPPRLKDLLRELRAIGPKGWTVFSPDADEVLRVFHEREPGRLRRKVTKGWGEMWRLVDPTPAE